MDFVGSYVVPFEVASVLLLVALIGAILLLGGIGYAIDSWRATGPWGLLVGLLLGLVVGFYELAKTIWRR